MREGATIWRTARTLRGVLLPYRATLLIIDKRERLVLRRPNPAAKGSVLAAPGRSVCLSSRSESGGLANGPFRDALAE
jgi:hypothetical protein